MKLVSYYDDATAYTGYLRIKNSEDEFVCKLRHLKAFLSDAFVANTVL